MIGNTIKAAGHFTTLTDGWSVGTSHFFCIIAGFIDSTTNEYDEALLAMQLTLEESDHSANAQIALFDSTLRLYGLSKDKLVCMIGDNCSVNQAISRKWRIPLVGCASHRFNLSMKKWIALQPDLLGALESLAKLMGKASNLKAAALLCETTLENHGKSYAAMKNNQTRWSSYLDMTKRYMKIKHDLAKVDELDPYALSKKEQAVLKAAHLPHFQIMKLVCNTLQYEGGTLHLARQLFASLLSDSLQAYNCMKDYLAPTAKIICSPDFENGCVKIIIGQV